MPIHDARLVTEHIDRFKTLEDKVGELVERIAPMEKTLDRLDGDFYNHGKDGMKTQFTNFVTEYRTEQSILKSAVDKHNWRIMFAVALVGLVLAALQLFIDSRNHQRNGSLHQPSITAPKTTGQIDTARNQQETLNAPHL